MPQISSNRAPHFIAGNEYPRNAEVMRFLKELSQELDSEICMALLEENNHLAERLNIQFVRANQLRETLKDVAKS